MAVHGRRALTRRAVTVGVRPGAGDDGRAGPAPRAAKSATRIMMAGDLIAEVRVDPAHKCGMVLSRSLQNQII